MLTFEGGLTVQRSNRGPKQLSEPLGKTMPFRGRQGGLELGVLLWAPRAGDTTLVGEQPVPTCAPQAKMCLDFF